jgi:thiamine pyrophosphokinase
VSAGPAEEGGRPLAVVFLDGEYSDPAWHRALAGGADILLAADGGAGFLAELGVTPAAVVGDFDSLDEATAVRLQDEGVEFLRHPVRKDVTDGELAVDEAVRRGAGQVLLAGATGALDHTLGHLAILRRLAARGIAARLVAPDLTVTILTAPAAVALAAPAGARVSIAPVGETATVTLTGLEYPLERGLLPADACLGLGNHVGAGGDARIELHAGFVVVLVGSADEPFRRVATRGEG